eukprot:6114907-Prymnesium_polylepis.1
MDAHVDAEGALAWSDPPAREEGQLAGGLAVAFERCAGPEAASAARELGPGALCLGLALLGGLLLAARLLCGILPSTGADDIESADLRRRDHSVVAGDAARATRAADKSTLGQNDLAQVWRWGAAPRRNSTKRL